MAKVLVLATSRHTHGGISSVVAAHEKTRTWREYGCRWIATHRSGSMLTKLAYMFRGLAEYALRLPAADIVHIHTSEPPSAARKLLFMRMARMLRKKTIVHFHAFDTEGTIESPKQHLYRKLFGMADGVVVLSPMWAEQVSRVFPEYKEKIRVLFNPCPEIKTSALADGEKTGENSILFAGVLNARKGYEQLIRAFAKVAPKFPSWRLVLAGSGEIEKAKDLAESLGVGHKVELTGWVSGDRKHLLFSDASVFCLPSFAEGFPMAVLEAWSYGLPVVATPVGGLPEIVEHGKDALLFPPGDVDELASELEKIMADEDLRKKISSSSKKMAKSTFNIMTIGSQLGEIYEEIAR